MTTDNSQLFAGEITDQLLATGKTGEMQVILTVKVTEHVTDEKAPGESNVPCPQQEAEVWLNFPGADEDRLAMSLRNIERLGYADDDLSRLHPDHPNCHLLIGGKVYLRPKIFNGLTYWNLAWPRERPKPAEMGAMKSTIDALAARIAAVRAKKSGGVPNRNSANGNGD